ncbi:MAG: AMIN domain-containing protein [Planctomycetota bacterium]
MRKIKMWISIIGSFLILLNSFPLPLAAQGGFETLDDVKIVDNSIVMTISGESKYHAFKISNPPRIVVEFTNTEHNWKQKELEVNSNSIKRIRSGQFQNEPVKIARVVVDLTQMFEYELKAVGKDVVLYLNPEAKANEDKKGDKPDTSQKTDEKVKDNVPETMLAAKAAVKVPAPKPAVTVVVPQVVATPVVKEEEPKVLPDKAKEIKQVQKAVTAAEPAKIPIKDKKETSQAAKKTKKLKTKEKTEEKNTGAVLPTNPVTLDFEEADIKDVLRILSMKSGINIIYGPDVDGNITLRLENVPFDKAFNTILSLRGLVSQEQGPNIIRIATPNQIAAERSQAVTFTKIFPLNYAKAEEVKSNLDSVRTAEGRKGSIAVDSRTNSLIVQIHRKG